MASTESSQKSGSLSLRISTAVVHLMHIDPDYAVEVFVLAHDNKPSSANGVKRLSVTDMMLRS